MGMEWDWSEIGMGMKWDWDEQWSRIGMGMEWDWDGMGWDRTEKNRIGMGNRVGQGWGMERDRDRIEQYRMGLDGE